MAQHPAATYVAGPSARVLEVKGRQLVTLAEKEGVSVPTYLKQRYTSIGKLQSRNSALLYLLLRHGIEVDEKLADLAAEPVQLLDMPTEMLQRITYYLLRSGQGPAELRLCDYIYHFFRMYGDWPHLSDIAEPTLASPILFRALLSQVLNIRSAYIDTLYMYDTDPRNVENIDDAIYDYKLLAKEIQLPVSSFIRHLTLRMPIGRYDYSDWEEFDWAYHRKCVNSVLKGLEGLGEAFPRLQSLVLDLTLENSGWHGFGLKHWDEYDAQDVMDNMAEVVGVLQSTGIPSIRFALGYFYPHTESQEVVDFRGLDASKAAKWICREEKEDRIFCL